MVSSGGAAVWVMSLMWMIVDVEGTWAWEWDRPHINNYSPINRYSRSRVPHVGVRRSIFDRFWGETTPNNPFLPTRLHPSLPRIRPRLNENDFMLTDADYEDDNIRDFHWFPQTQHSNQPTKSLEGLQHILEGKQLGPISDPSSSPTGLHHKSSSDTSPSHNEEQMANKQKYKQMKYGQRHNHHHEVINPSSDERSNHFPPSDRTDSLPHHLPDFGAGAFTHEGHLLSNGHDFSKDFLHDFQEPLSMPERFTNSKQFPKDFISPEQFPGEFGGMAEPLPKDHLTTDPFVSDLEGHKPFQEHLLLSPLQNSGFQNPDHNILNLDTDQTLSEVDLPQIFPNLGILGKIGKPNSFIHQERLGHFGLPNAESSDSLPEGAGEGLQGWLPPSLSELNLPSHGHMISTLEQQKLSKEAHRDACHARNLHSCGSRLIDEFAFGPDNPDKCRIREEFLDCMEQVMKLPCELHGERYSREGTKLIRDKIKTLLWSAQGCILGYSN